MKKVWREIVINLTPEEESVWERAVSNFWQTTSVSDEYYECPISPSEKGKARLPCDPEIILELTTQLQRLENADESICKQLSQKLAQLYSREKII
jgi:hypothetical protein